MAERSVGTRIEEIRRQKGMSRQELADKLSTPKSKVTYLQVWRIETGALGLDANDVPAWADALECSVQTLYRESRAS